MPVAVSPWSRDKRGDDAEGCTRRRLSTMDARSQWHRRVVVVDVVVSVDVFVVVAVTVAD